MFSGRLLKICCCLMIIYRVHFVGGSTGRPRDQPHVFRRSLREKEAVKAPFLAQHRNTTLISCALMCLSEFDGKCTSFNFFEQQNLCQLSRFTIWLSHFVLMNGAKHFSRLGMVKGECIHTVWKIGIFSSHRWSSSVPRVSVPSYGMRHTNTVGPSTIRAEVLQWLAIFQVC